MPYPRPHRNTTLDGSTGLRRWPVRGMLTRARTGGGRLRVGQAVIANRIGGGVGRLRDSVARGLVRLGATPNALTVVGWAVTVTAGVLVSIGRLRAGGVVLFVAGAFDMLDGAVARVGDRRTDFGAFLDSSLDRIGDLAVFGGLAVHFCSLGNLTYTVLSILALGAAEVISYTRARAECLIDSCHVGFWERGERTMLIIVALVVGRAAPALWLLTVLPWFTVFHRVCYTRRQMAGGRADRSPSLPARVFFFSPRRGSLLYDLAAAAVLAALLFLPIPRTDPLGRALNRTRLSTTTQASP